MSSQHTQLVRAQQEQLHTKLQQLGLALPLASVPLLNHPLAQLILQEADARLQQQHKQQQQQQHADGSDVVQAVDQSGRPRDDAQQQQQQPQGPRWLCIDVPEAEQLREAQQEERRLQAQLAELQAVDRLLTAGMDKAEASKQQVGAPPLLSMPRTCCVGCLATSAQVLGSEHVERCTRAVFGTRAPPPPPRRWRRRCRCATTGCPAAAPRCSSSTCGPTRCCPRCCQRCRCVAGPRCRRTQDTPGRGTMGGSPCAGSAGGRLPRTVDATQLAASSTPPRVAVTRVCAAGWAGACVCALGDRRTCCSCCACTGRAGCWWRPTRRATRRPTSPTTTNWPSEVVRWGSGGLYGTAAEGEGVRSSCGCVRTHGRHQALAGQCAFIPAHLWPDIRLSFHVCRPDAGSWCGRTSPRRRTPCKPARRSPRPRRPARLAGCPPRPRPRAARPCSTQHRRASPAAARRAGCRWAAARRGCCRGWRRWRQACRGRRGRWAPPARSWTPAWQRCTASGARARVEGVPPCL